MTQDIKLNDSQKQQFDSIMAGMAFIDKMIADGNSVEDAFTVLETKLGVK